MSVLAPVPFPEPAVHPETTVRRDSPCTILPFKRPVPSAIEPVPSPIPQVRPDVESLLGLVHRIASWFEHKWSLPAGMEHDDIVAIGVIGLLKSMQRFDPARRCSIETYAGYAIRGAIFRHLTKTWTALNHEAPLPDREMEGPWPSPEKAVLYRELQDAVFFRLNDIDQTLVIGRLEERTFAELGHQLRMTISSANRHHERALRRLRTELGAGGGSASKPRKERGHEPGHAFV